MKGRVGIKNKCTKEVIPWVCSVVKKYKTAGFNLEQYIVRRSGKSDTRPGFARLSEWMDLDWIEL